MNHLIKYFGKDPSFVILEYITLSPNTTEFKSIVTDGAYLLYDKSKKYCYKDSVTAAVILNDIRIINYLDSRFGYCLTIDDIYTAAHHGHLEILDMYKEYFSKCSNLMSEAVSGLRATETVNYLNSLTPQPVVRKFTEEESKNQLEANKCLDDNIKNTTKITDDSIIKLINEMGQNK
jgi:hypothetical protein